VGGAAHRSGGWGKFDTLDAENAALAGLSGQANTVPRTNDGTVEMLRQIKIAKDTL
jgi:transposase